MTYFHAEIPLQDPGRTILKAVEGTGEGNIRFHARGGLYTGPFVTVQPGFRSHTRGGPWEASLTGPASAPGRRFSERRTSCDNPFRTVQFLLWFLPDIRPSRQIPSVSQCPRRRSFGVLLVLTFFSPPMVICEQVCLSAPAAVSDFSCPGKDPA